jgi:hypothetical protein
MAESTSQARPNRFAKGTNHHPLVWARVIVALQLLSLVAVTAWSLADCGLLVGVDDLVVASSGPAFAAFLFSLFLAPVLVVALAWSDGVRGTRLGAVLILEFCIILALLYAIRPLVQ